VPPPADLAGATRVRRFDASGRHALAVVPGIEAKVRSTEWVFATDAVRNEARAFRHELGMPLAATSQGPVSTSDEPIQVTIDAQRKHIYVTCASGVINKFDFDVSTGELTTLAVATVGTTASLFLLPPYGRFACAFDGKDLYNFLINSATGVLGSRNTVQTFGDTPLSAAIDPANLNLLVGTAAGFDIADFRPRAPPLVGISDSASTGHPVNDLVINPSGTMLYAADTVGEVDILDRFISTASLG